MPETAPDGAKRRGPLRYFEPWMISQFMIGLISAAAFLVPPLITDRGGFPTDIGLVLAIIPSLALAAPLVGGLLDRYHWYRLFHGIGLASIAIGVAILGFSYALGGWIAGAFVTAIGLPLVFIVNLSLTVGGGFSEEETAKRVAVVTLLFTLGQALILVVTSVLVGRISYEAIYSILAAIAAVGLLVTMATNRTAAQRATAVSNEARAQRAGEASEARRGGRRPKGAITVAFVAFLAASFLTYFGFSSYDSQYPLFLNFVFGLSIGVAALSTGIALLVALAIYPVAGIWVARSGARVPYLVNLLVRVIAAGGTTALGGAAPGGGGVAVLLYSSVMLAWPLMDVSSPILTSRTNRLGTGAAQGLYTLMLALGLIVGPIVGGLIAQVRGYPFLSIVFFVANAIALAIAFFFMRVKRPEPAPPGAAVPV